MSLAQMVQVLEHSQSEGKELLVLIAIAERDGEGGAWPSMSWLAKRGRVTESYARRLVRKLEESGEIITDLNGGGGIRTAQHMRTNRYSVNIPCPWYCDRTPEHRDLRESKNEARRPKAWAEIVLDNTPAPPTVPNPPTAPNPPHHTEPTPGSVRWGEPSINLPTTPEQSLEAVVSASAHEVPPGGVLTPSEGAAYAAAVTAKPAAAYGVQPAPAVPRFDPATIPARPELVSAEQQQLNVKAEQFACPDGFGTGKGSRHWCPPTDAACVRCGADVADILTRAQEPTA